MQESCDDAITVSSTNPHVCGTRRCPPPLAVCTNRRHLCPLQALLQSRIARNADFAVMLGDAHLEAIGEDTYTKLMRGCILLGGPGPEPRLSDSLPGVRQPRTPPSVQPFAGLLTLSGCCSNSGEGREMSCGHVSDASSSSLLCCALRCITASVLCCA